MNIATILGFAKAILPTKRISAWILGLIAAVIAVVMGVSGSDLKAQFCANDPVDIPKIEIPATAPEIVPEAK